MIQINDEVRFRLVESIWSILFVILMSKTPIIVFAVAIPSAYIFKKIYSK